MPSGKSACEPPGQRLDHPGFVSELVTHVGCKRKHARAARRTAGHEVAFSAEMLHYTSPSNPWPHHRRRWEDRESHRHGGSWITRRPGKNVRRDDNLQAGLRVRVV
jgi:hypothetical protein